MYYKIIVYKKNYTKIETKKGLRKVVYFQKVATYHGIHKTTLTKKYLQVWEKWKDTCYHISEILETEQDTIIENYNTKAKKYGVLVGV